MQVSERLSRSTVMPAMASEKGLGLAAETFVALVLAMEASSEDAVVSVSALEVAQATEHVRRAGVVEVASLAWVLGQVDFEMVAKTP